MANRIARILAAIPRTDAPTALEVKAPTNGHGPTGQDETKAVTILPRLQFWLPGNEGGSMRPDIAASPAAYSLAALAYICIRYRATKIREAPLMVVKETDDGEEWLPNHPLAKSGLLARPNPDYGIRRLTEITEINLCTTGRCLWIKNRDRMGQVGSMYPFDGDQFSVESMNGRLYGRFKVGGKYYAPEDVVYFSYVDPADPLGGLSPLKAAITSLNIAQNLQHRVISYVKNAMMPGGIYVADKEWRATDTEFARLKSELSQTLKGLNSGDPAIAEGGGKIERGWSLSELALGELWREVEATVCGVFGVPASLVGTVVGMENSPWSHLETAKRSFYDETILPEWEFLEEVITDSLLRPVDADETHLIRFDTSRIRALQRDIVAGATVAGAAARFTSVNERRMMIGQEPDDDPRADLIPELENPNPAPFGGGGGDPGDQGDGSGDDNEADKDEKAGKAFPRRPATKGRAQAPREVGGAVEALGLAAADTTLDENEAVWEYVLAGLLDRDRTAISALAIQEGKAQGFAEIFMGLVDEYLKGIGFARWMGTVPQLVKFTGEAALKNLVLAGSPAPVRVSQARVSGLADRTATWLIKNISDTTREAVKNALAAGMEAGEPPATIARRIADLPEFDRARARLVARTETTRAYNAAQFDAIKAQEAATGLVFTKRWVATLDDRVRETHAATHGEVVALDGKFSNGCDYPGDHKAPPGETCNCRCVLTYGTTPATR